MAGCVLLRILLLKCLLLLSLSGCQGQKDCTGVDCPKLENCIEESLANGPCCATCARKGCTCQGYQYYDCVNAGFRDGKVPEGESYFVDFGSTECSCPTGGGRISCHFIPCPDIPANCIELSEPADGCIQCKRVGCVHNEQRYEAGHSFHMDPCQVCHCPNDGGSLMCYPIPDCDPRKVEKPMLATTTEENAHHNKNPLQFIFQHQGPSDHLSKPLRPAHGDTLPLLPLFTQHPNNLEDEEEEEMDYDYLPIDTPGPPLQDLAAPTESSIISVSYPESFTPRGPSLYRNGKQELRETFAVHHEVAARVKTTPAPATTLQQTTPHHQVVTTSSWQRAFENQVLPLETAHTADHDDVTGATDADEEDEIEEQEEERLAPSHGFTVFPHGGNHASSAVHRHDGKRTPSRPVVPDHGLNRNTHSRPKTVEVDQDRSTMTDHGHDGHTQIKPVIVEMDRNRSIFADHGRNRNAQSKPVLKELDQDRGTFTDQRLSKATQSRPVIPEVSSFADHGINRNAHSRPKTVEVDQDRSTMTDHGHDRHTQIKPVIAEMDRNRSSFADHGRNRNTQSGLAFKELDKDRDTSTDQSLSKAMLNRNTHSNPVMGEAGQDRRPITDDGHSRDTQRRPIMEEIDRHRGTSPQHGQREETETRPATAEIDRDKGSLPQNRPVFEELDLHGVTSPHQEQSQITQSRPNTQKLNLHKTTQTGPGVVAIDSDKGSFAGHGLNRNSQSQPVAEELDRLGGTYTENRPGKTSQPILEEADQDSSTFPEPAQSEILHTRPAMSEIDRDKGSFADHVRNRNPQSRPVIKEFDQDRGMFTGQGHSKPTQTRPVTEKVDPDKGTGHQPWRPSMEQIVRQADRLQENHVTPPVPPVVVNFAEHTTHRPPPQQRFSQIHTVLPTSQPPLRVKADGGFPGRNQTQAFTDTHAEQGKERERERERERVEERDNSLSSLPVDNRGSVAMRQVETCCEVGKKWAAEHYHCNHMPAMSDDNNILCSVVQEQCCTGALRQSRCLAGMSAARGGDACQAPPDGRLCGEDSYQECCSCCSLGLQLREAGLGCHAHQHLDYPCGHILLTCCEEVEEGEEAAFGGYVPDGPELRRKEMPRPTTTPKKVTDRRPVKEAFSVGDGEDAAANSLEETGGVGDSCQNFAARLCHHICIDTWGSYQCRCHPGHVLLQDGHTCAPEDSEEDNRVREEEQPVTHATSRLTTSTTPSSTSTTTTTTTTTQIPVLLNPCAGNGPCAQRCSVAGGHAKCSCFPGFSLMADGHSCEDVNECRRGTHNCSRGDFCVNSEGSYRCVHLNEMCDEGFIHNVNRQCVDVDECITNTHTCKPTERCVNTVGAFMCERQISCSSGYQLRNGVCEDIDECVTRTHNCGGTMECRNTEGSFSCVPKQQRCYTGFTQDTHGNCIDIDECTSLAEPCSSGFNCINTVGSYTCQRKVIMCSTGYHASPDGARCIDVDECQTGIHRCGEGQICQNVPGSYRCNCQTGYQYDAIRQTCVDVNECWRYPGRLCAQTCENTPGSYQCSCTAGFSLAFDGKNCEDVNECDRNPCSQECANIYGSYQCYCRQGFYLKEDGHTCEDIDECSQSIGHLCAFQCVNIPGSYQCACPATGYSMSPNGRTCRDIDECAIGSHNCSLSESCFNIQGGFRCLSFACPSNYRKVSDTRCERVSCLNVQDCQSSPLRITYYQLSFQTNIIIPAQIFRIGPSPAYAGDSIMIGITRGNEGGYFSTRRLNSFTGAVYLQRQVREPRDFLIDVEMKLLRQGTFTTFLARIYVFITANAT